MAGSISQHSPTMSHDHRWIQTKEDTILQVGDSELPQNFDDDLCGTRDGLVFGSGERQSDREHRFDYAAHRCPILVFSEKFLRGSSGKRGSAEPCLDGVAQRIGVLDLDSDAKLSTNLEEGTIESPPQGVLLPRHNELERCQGLEWHLLVTRVRDRHVARGHQVQIIRPNAIEMNAADKPGIVDERGIDLPQPDGLTMNYGERFDRA